MAQRAVDFCHSQLLQELRTLSMHIRRTRQELANDWKTSLEKLATSLLTFADRVLDARYFNLANKM